MEFSLSEEQRLLQDSISRYLVSECPLDDVRDTSESGETLNAKVWSGLADLGIQGLLVPEEYGGVGLGMLEAALVAEALGSVIAPTPFIGACVMAPVALVNAGSDEQKETWLPQICQGSVVANRIDQA